MIDIFAEAQRTPFYFKEVGDKVQGTYIGKEMGKDKWGGDQVIYLLKRGGGGIWAVPFKVTSFILIQQMEQVNLGQIIGFIYSREADSAKSKTGKTNIIEVVHRPDLVDVEWLESRKRGATSYSLTAEKSHSMADVPFGNTADEVLDEKEVMPLNTSAPALNGNTKIESDPSGAFQAVRNLAVMKGVVNAEDPNEEKDKIIAEKVKMALTEENLPEVIKALLA